MEKDINVIKTSNEYDSSYIFFIIPESGRVEMQHLSTSHLSNEAN